MTTDKLGPQPLNGRREPQVSESLGGGSTPKKNHTVPPGAIGKLDNRIFVSVTLVNGETATVIVSAPRGLRVPWRLFRLVRLADFSAREKLSVVGLHDNDGQLAANFAHTPSPDELGVLHQAWIDAGGASFKSVYVQGKFLLGRVDVSAERVWR
jgi:hypothetical protein